MLTYTNPTYTPTATHKALRTLLKRLRSPFAGLSSWDRSRARNICRGYIDRMRAIYGLAKSVGASDDVGMHPRAFIGKMATLEMSAAAGHTTSRALIKGLLDDMEADLVNWRTWSERLLVEEIKREAASSASNSA